MRSSGLFLTLAAALFVGSSPVAAQAPATPASAPAAKPAMPHVPTPAERRDSARVPGELRPEQPVVPQIKLPIGRKAPVAPQTAASAAQHRKTPAPGGIEDAAARCAAQASSSARARCRDRLARGR